MKKIVVCSSDNPMVNKLKESSDFEIVSECRNGKIYAEILYMPDVVTLEKRYNERLTYKLIVIVEALKTDIYRALFPGLVIIPMLPAFTSDLIDAIYNNKRMLRERPRFTNNETRLLYQLCSGMSNKELCEVLNMSDRSVRRVKQNLMDKIGLNSSLQLAVYALYTRCRQSGLFNIR